MIYSKIAGLNIEIDCVHEDYFNEKLAEYIICNPKECNDIDLRLSFSLKDKLDIGDFECLNALKNTVFYKIDEHTKMVVVYYQKVPVKIYKFSNDHSHAHIDFAPYKGQFFPDVKREFFYSLDVFIEKMLYNGGMCFHSSAIGFKGAGIGFSAISGTGKSTHASLWKACFPDDIIHINDDKPAITFNDKGATIHGTPWSGKTDINTNISMPLKAIVFIKQSPENKVHRLGIKESYYYTLNNTFRSVYDSSLDDKYIAGVERIVNTIPCYKLECNISNDAVYVLKSKLEEDNII